MTEVVRSGGLTIAHNLPEFRRLMERAPEATAFHGRVMIGRWYTTTLREWRNALTPRLRRMQRRGAVLFFLDPKGRTDREIREAVKNQPFSAISGKFLIRNEAPLLLEFGGVVRPKNGSFLAIPAGRWRRMGGERRRAQIGEGPADYKRRGLGPELFPLNRRRAGAQRLFLGRVKPGTEASPKPRVEAVFMLVRQSVVPPQLGLRDAWAGQEPYRNRTAGEAVQRIATELAGGVRRAKSA